MKDFNYEIAHSIEEAAKLKSPKTSYISGGTDVLGVLKDEVLANPPETLIDLKGIENLKGITESDQKLSIGATTTLSELTENQAVQKYFPMLAEAAHSVATPNIRNVATVGGNICQNVRCWFYRYPNEVGGLLNCMRKGGSECFAIRGDNRNHSIFGGVKMSSTPCTLGCVNATEMPVYFELLREGKIDAACWKFMEVNPMPMVTSRVCAHLCETNCNRNATDEAVKIHSIERYIGDHIRKHPEKFYNNPLKETGHKIAVIGAGPAGLTAAYFLRQEGNTVEVIDKMEEPGGLLTYALPSYRMPKEMIQELVTNLKNMGIVFTQNVEIGKDITVQELENNYDKVIYATGAWKRPVLGFDGEEFTEFGLDFLVEVNQWLTKKERNDVLVIGGGNVAMDVAITAKRLGAKRVRMACLECEDEMPASVEEIARAREEGIEIMPSYGVSKAIYEDGKVIGMELKRCICLRNADNHFDPQYDESERLQIEADSILMCAGQQVDLSFLNEEYEIAIERGTIQVDPETQKTSREGIFAAGDMTTGPSTVVASIRGGRNAAEKINKEYGLGCCRNESLDILHVDTEGIKNPIAVQEKELSVEERNLDKEDSQTLSWEEIETEVRRCMNCGCYCVDPSDIAPVLIALKANIITNERTIPAETFFCSTAITSDYLHREELVTTIDIPIVEGGVMHYDKFRLRNALDFAIVSLASVFAVVDGIVKEARLVMGGVAPLPRRAHQVEAFLLNKEITESLAEEAAELAVKDATPFEKNQYKVVEIKHLITQAILRAAE